MTEDHPDLFPDWEEPPAKPAPPPRAKGERRKNPVAELHGYHENGERCGTCKFYIWHMYVPNGRYNRCEKSKRSNHRKTWKACKFWEK